MARKKIPRLSENLIEKTKIYYAANKTSKIITNLEFLEKIDDRPSISHGNFQYVFVKPTQQGFYFIQEIYDASHYLYSHPLKGTFIGYIKIK